MVKNTQFLNDYSNTDSFNYSSKNSTSVNNISNRITNESNSNISRGKNFNEVLNLKKQSNINERSNNKKDNFADDNSKSISNTDELKRKINELKEEIENKDYDENKVRDILEELLNALNCILGKRDSLEELNNSSTQNNLLEVLTEQIFSNNSKESNLLQQLLQSKDMKELLEQLSINLNENSNYDSNKGINDMITKLDEVIQNIDGQGNEKVIIGEEIFNQNSTMENDSDNSSMLEKKNDNKEDKFLNSLLEDNKDTVDNKINLFATRTQSIQGPNGDVRGLTINKTTFTSDLIKDIKYMSINNLKQLTVKVNPGNLGEVTIKLIQEDGIMKANLKANSKETTALLSQNLSEIKKELSEQSIKIAEVNIELYNEDTTFFRNDSFGSQLSQEQNRGTKNTKDANDAEYENESIAEENLASIDNNLDFLV